MGSDRNRSSGSSRRDRIQEMRRAEQARERRGRITVVAVSAVVVAALVGGGVWLVTKDDGAGGSGGSDKADAKPSATGHFKYAKNGVGTWSEKLGRDHVASKVAYAMTPPVGGNHNQVWMNCNGDVYDKDLPNENAVHALEHGAVWVTYTDKAAEKDVKALAAKVKKTPYSLMSPLAGQKDPIMLSAWGHQRTVKSAKDPAVDSFFATYVQGKQTPEPGAPCTGGLSG
ncbi:MULTISPECIES: DUF3105 domain-containing protein [unclassified Streptomyces]|uniref:DUF3105 domain-containing protein n=1 Tax=unclassified Streptomyces TaxID=2593676 RepID=UPI00278C6406|nr:MULTISPECIES: DUF3105 domain-containing protein [unclassified Streptomyces]